ncbi:MAG TPA: ATP-binding protein [Candidatus Polarisedimenticolia bacterium]|nr:ATP-binding protein [Candidatus Polarisedimenticolia bacterium]
MARWRLGSLGFGWLIGVSVAAIVAINLAGFGGIALARRGALEEAGRVLTLETAAQARSLESRLASSRADLTYLTGSPIFFGLETALRSADPTQARWRRLEAEGSLLLFLRAHPEVARVQAHAQSGSVLMVAARRGGIPVLWMAPDAEAGKVVKPREVDVPQQPLTADFAFRTGDRTVSGTVSLQATLDPARLLSEDAGASGSTRDCRISDASGKMLAREGGPAPGAASTTGDDLVARAPVQAEAWQRDGAWELTCRRSPAEILARVEPLAGRYRTTLLLNALVMSLALLLGMFAIQQTRRRARLEAIAEEETRVRELERQLFHAERLSTVGRLAAGIAHEINNPLEGMSNYLSLARADLGKSDVASAHKRLDGVAEGLKRAEEIVRRVLAHADPSVAPQTPVELGEILRQSAGFVRERPEFGGVKFDLDLPQEPLVVKGNAAMLGQVFLNLLLNACEAQPGGGEVRVKARGGAAETTVEIADRGPGVPSSSAGKIFEPFFSTKNSSGLGLSICYAIARRHDAELKVESRPGGGALFKMIFKTGATANA